MTTTTNGDTHHCDPCDKSFKDERALYLHESEHELCGRDGCQYWAHPKLVAKHIRMQHDTGLYRRIGKLKTEEDIAKWLEERKRRYPTRKVVEEKKALEEEKEKRGERIKEDNSKFNKSFNKKKDRRKMKSFERKSIKERKSGAQKKRRREPKEERLTVSEALKEETSWRGSVPPFNGIGTLDEEESTPQAKDEGSEFSDDEWEVSTQTQPASRKERVDVKTVSNSLGMLASCYDSDIDHQDRTEVPPAAETGKPGSDDDSAPEEVKTVHVKETEVVETTAKRKRTHQGRRRGKRGRAEEEEVEENGTSRREVRVTWKREPTLLEKLLSREIRHERNVILQCVRYVVDRNFFLES